MNPCNVPASAKPARRLPRVWSTFWKVEKYDDFDLGSPLRYTRVGLFRAEYYSSIYRELRTKYFFPWTRVRTSQLVRDARPGGKSSQTVRKESDTSNPGQTHYVGDSCPGGHYAVDATARNPDGSCYHGTSYAHPQTEQPHNDNTTHGPTA